MACCVFYSFHYNADNARASQVRNMGVVEGNRPATDNEWEQVKEAVTRRFRVGSTCSWMENHAAWS